MKVGLIVDNPRRDLRGMLLLAKKFLDNNFEVYIIPNYHLYEAYLLNLDWILLHNCRVMQKKYISLFNKLKIKIGILDTEGAQLGPKNKDLKYFAKIVSENLEFVDLYFLWGAYQKKIINDELLKTNNVKLINKCKVTGHPRFELYKKNYLNFNEPIDKVNKIITFNTNFVWNSPRFSKNAEKELMIGVHQYYGDKTIAQDKFSDELILKKNFIETIKIVANNFNSYKIIINPHPFENINDYKILAKKYNNIIVIKDIYLPKLFKNSDYLISYNCQTCVDSYLMGYKTISINFIDKKNQLSDYFRSICINIDSVNELLKILKNNEYDKNHNDNNKELNQLFFNNSPSDDIVKHILNEKKLKNRFNKLQELELLYRILFFAKTSTSSYFRIFFKILIIFFSSSHFFYKIKSLLKSNYFFKKYTRHDVGNFYDLLYKQDTIKVENAYAKKFSLLFKKLSSFRILKNEKN